MANFRALVLEQGADRKVSAAVQEVPEDRLPAGDVTVQVEHSTLNYKDGLVLTTGGGLVKTWPHVGGIDLQSSGQAEAGKIIQLFREGLDLDATVAKILARHFRLAVPAHAPGHLQFRSGTRRFMRLFHGASLREEAGVHAPCLAADELCD